MLAMTYEPDLKQRVLDRELDLEPDIPFISDWNGSHPFACDYLGSPELYAAQVTDVDHYVWMVTDKSLLRDISNLHSRFCEESIGIEQLIPGAGSSSFLATYALWLASRQVREIFYIPPLYFVLHQFLKLLNIRARPITGHHAFEPGFGMNLPTHRCDLLLTDPVWYAGVSMAEETI